MKTPAEDAAANNNGYNYYPNAMITLCVISYEDISDIANNVAKTTDWKVVWGPAELVDDFDISYSLAYVAQRTGSTLAPEYVVVIRGTEYDSLTDWITEDFEIDGTVAFNTLVPAAPSGAVISEATSDGINDLLSLTDPNTGASMIDFLTGLRGSFYLYVTGHSLGGTLTPPMLLYLNYKVFGGSGLGPMALWSFAGLTPGNGAFNTYLQSLGNPNFPFRIYNTLDIAPLLWWNRAGLSTIYLPTYKIGLIEEGLFDSLFGLAAGKGYAQPASGGAPITGTLENPPSGGWLDEAEYQHHSTTYQTMVQLAYPQS
jgi:hypothetical protein